MVLIIICQNDNIKQKQKETNIERYGVDNHFKSKSIIGKTIKI